MVQLLTQPPPPEVVARLSAIDGVRMNPTMLVTQQGPDGALGPESAGAMLLLQATFVDDEGLRQFWNAAAGLTELLASAPGFIRRFNFSDGPHYTLIALWRSPADADAFFGRAEHQAAMRELFQGRWEYTHFAGLWEVVEQRHRVIFCQQCDGVTPTSQKVCVGCGTVLFDPFALALSDVDG